MFIGPVVLRISYLVLFWSLSREVGKERLRPASAGAPATPSCSTTSSQAMQFSVDNQQYIVIMSHPTSASICLSFKSLVLRWLTNTLYIHPDHSGFVSIISTCGNLLHSENASPTSLHAGGIAAGDSGTRADGSHHNWR